MSGPWLSVIMPTYNGAAYLRQALHSLKVCAHTNLELVAVDDGSTDATIDLFEQYGRHYPLRLIRQAHGGNWVASSNRGLLAASGEYACFLHQDDIWLPRRAEILRRLTATYPEMALFVHPAWFIGSRGQRVNQWRCPFSASHNPLPAKMMLEKLLIQNCFAMPAPLFRRRDAVEVGGMDERLWYTADWDFWLKLAKRGGAVYYSQPLAAFRVHHNSQTALRTSDLADMRWQLETVLNLHLPSIRDCTQFASIESAARLSVECNLWLAASRHWPLQSLGMLLQAAIVAGPFGVARYFRDSGIIERVVARILAGR
jgi:glycosyltransferase involved in cell wall biosynthesis